MSAMNLDAELDGSNDDYDDCLLQVTVAFLHLVRSSKNSHVNILLSKT